MTIKLGFTPLLLNVKLHGWQEAYGYLGSYHKTFDGAMSEINYLLKRYPDDYSAWAIERVAIEDNTISINDDFRTCIIAQSKDAPIWSAAIEKVNE